MRTAIDAVCIQDGKLLLVKKKEVWILPGGKPYDSESDIDCMLREICIEELPGTRLEKFELYRTFRGVTPHTRDLLEARAYFADISGELKPSAEINGVEWAEDARKYNLSDITGKFVDSLIKDGYLR